MTTLSDTETWAQKSKQRDRLHRCLDRLVGVSDELLSDFDFVQVAVSRADGVSFGQIVDDDLPTWLQKSKQRDRLHRCLDRHVRVADELLSDYEFIQAVVARHNEDAKAHIEGPT